MLIAACGGAACARAPGPLFRLKRPPAPAVTASLTGSVTTQGERAADLVGAIVFLEPIAHSAPHEPVGDAEIRIHRGGFAPGFLVVQRGQRVTWTNLDRIFHGVFSYSNRNQFDLGVFGPNEARGTSLARLGPVRVHCPIHVSEGGIVFVAPSPYYAVSGQGAAYAIRGVPPGRYWLSAWIDGWSAAAREITLRLGESAHADVLLRPERD